ncbi:MAG TPA: membrane dipeptidase [Caldimonas sp.]|nr:membrane dipeptidase [Caldimonas sp.]
MTSEAGSASDKEIAESAGPTAEACLAASPVPRLRRRTLLQAAWPAFGLGPLLARGATPPVPIADMHSHYGILRRPTLPSATFAAELRAARIALIAWAMPADLGWTRTEPSGIVQKSVPPRGELATAFRRRLDRMRAYVARSGLRAVLTRADVDACMAGDSGVILASEGADFLEGRVDALAGYVDMGLRHLQLVHYIRTPIGDFQTVQPTHGGLSDAGHQLVEACNEQGVLVDLAHCSGPAVEQALSVATKPLVWSHGWVDRTEGSWQDRSGFLRRRLSLDLARKIADRGGVVGLWGLGLRRPGPSRTPGEGNWTVGRDDASGYARELAHLVDWLGADHVGIGTDLEGVGDSESVSDYAQVRAVIDALQAMKLPAATVEKVAALNYVRVLKSALRR